MTSDTTESNRATITAAFEAWRDRNVPIGGVFNKLWSEVTPAS
jgi:hypothetical protein